MTCIRLHLLLLPVALLGETIHAATPTGAGWHLAWNDEFEGTTLDTSKWRHWLPGARRDAVNSPSAVSVANGNLNIATYTSGGIHYTGMISTQSTYPYTYGYIEARIQYTSTPGMWSAFWMQSDSMGNPIGSPNTAGTEIDICEHRAINSEGENINGRIVENIHWDGYGSAHRSIGYTSPDLGLGTGFHIYGMEWTPTQQKFYINGILRWTINNGPNSPVSHRSEFIILSSEVSNGSWAGSIPSGGYGNPADSTTSMIIDYVRVYRRAETVVNGDFEGHTAPFSRENQASWSSTGGHSAPAAAKLAPTSSAGATVRQALHGIMPDTGYTLTAWGNAGSNAPSLTIGANNFGGTQVSQTLTSSSDTKATVPFTTGPTHRSASVFAKSNHSGSTAYVDDFLVRRHATVNNGNLESGAHEAWNSTYGGSTISSESTYDGTFAWKIPASGSSAGVEQEIVGLSPSTTYRLSGWTNNGNSGLTFGVKNHGASQVTNTVAANTWSRATVNFTTGSNNTSATAFAFRGSSPQNAFADAFFLYQPLASPWTSADISTTGLAGIAGRLGEKFTLQASGANLGSTADRMHFLYQPLTGDATITARILGVDTTAYHAKTGVMIRESTAAGARSAAITWGPVNRMTEFIRRSSNNATATNTSTLREITSPPWVRLTRRGNAFTAYHSPDGLAWTRVGAPQTIAMATSILIGVPACSGDSTRITEALLDHLTITAPVPDVVITSPNQGITLTHNGQSLRLTATITSSASPTIAWSKVSGPGTVAFGNSTLTGTSATFSAPGTYILRCSATAAPGTGSADLTVNISPATLPDPTLALRLKLDETSGIAAADSSGNNQHATATGALSWQPAGGVLSGAASFDGKDSHLEVPDHNLLDASSALTFSFWFRASSLGNNTGLVSKRVSFDNNNSYGTYLGLDGKLYVDVVSSNNRFTSNTTFNSGNWYHIALVFNGSFAEAERVRLYVNGTLDRTATETSTTIPNFTAPLRIGMLNSGGTIFDGLIDEVRIHRRALSPAEVLAASAETATFGPNVATGEAPAARVNTPAALNGSVTVEAGPTPTVLWTKISGPGNVNFSNPTSPNNTVTIDKAGDYILRLTATNASGETFAELSDTVFEAALPAPDLTITNPAAPVSIPDFSHRLRLTATADTHNVPGTPIFAWKLIAGPGTATFANPAAADTTVTFSSQGTYLLRCAASNAAGMATAQTSVTIGSTTATVGLREGVDYSHVGTFIRSDVATWNSGARDSLVLGKLENGHPLRGILSFPLDWLPSAASLSSVSLDLWTHPVDGGAGTFQTLELRPLFDTPVEGTGNASSSSSITGNGTGATWLNRTENQPWTTAGGDFPATVLSSQSSFDPTLKSAHCPFASTQALVNATQSTLAAAAALDLVLISPGTESLADTHLARFASDDHANIEIRPRLNLAWSTQFAPAITLGSATAAINGIPASLGASLANATASLWKLVSGPGNATFANPASPSTSITFDQPGTYHLQLTATGPHGETARSLTIDVNVNPAIYTDWQAITWPGLSTPEIISPTADPDQDGNNNLLEWALHLDPNSPDTVPISVGKAGSSLELTYTRRITSGASFIVEWSDTLEEHDWSTEDIITEAPDTLTPTTESVLSTIPATTERRFVRLRIQSDW